MFANISDPHNQNELLPQSVLDAAPFGAFITDAHLNLIQVNQWILSHIQRPVDELLNRPLQEVFPEIASCNLIEAYRLVLRSRSSMTISHRIHHHLIKMPSVIKEDAEDMPQTAMVVPINTGKKITGTLTYILDLTERINSERELQQEVEKLIHLHEIDRALATLNLDQCLEIIVSRSHHLFHARSTALFLNEGGRLRLVASNEEAGSQFILENSSIDQAVAEKKPFLVPENRLDPRFNDPQGPVQMEISAPLIISNDCIGVLAVQSHDRNAYGADDLALLDMLASRAATAIHNARLHDAERSQRQFSDALYQITLNLSSQHDPEEMLNDILDQAAKVIPYDSACFMVLEREKVFVKEMRGYGRFGLSEVMQNAEFPLSDLAFLHPLIRTHRPHAISDIRTDPMWRENSPFKHAHSWIGAPIVIRNEVIGFLSLDKIEAGFYTAETENRLAAFAALAGVALENARLHAEQERLARTDGLTGLANRRRFDEALAHEINRARRYQKKLSLILMDIDKFKQYNDCYGHQAGDHLLKNMAVALSSELRNFDVFARYGGEEFVVILPETDLNAAAAVAERMRATMETLHSAPPLEDYPIPAHRVTISLGVSTLCAQTPDGPAMISEADTALYYAKDTGRNRVVVLPCPEALG